jgi:hypothetical protein
MDLSSVDKPEWKIAKVVGNPFSLSIGKMAKVVGSGFMLSLFFWYWAALPIFVRAQAHGARRALILSALIFSTTAVYTGVYLFVKGLAIYREFRLLLVTAEAPIGALAMGFVEVHGKATGDQNIISPLSQTPCFYYQVFLDVEVGVGPKNSPEGFTKWECTRFYLQDATGKVRVNPVGIEGDLMLNEDVKFSASRDLLAGRSAPVSREEELAKYAQEIAANRVTIFKGRFREYCILPGHSYDLAGTCVENPEPLDEWDRNMIEKGSQEPTFLVSGRSEKGIKARVHRQATLGVWLGGALILLGAAGGLAVFGLL